MGRAAGCSIGPVRVARVADWRIGEHRADRRDGAGRWASDFVVAFEVDVAENRSIGTRRKGWNSVGCSLDPLRMSEERILASGWLCERHSPGLLDGRCPRRRLSSPLPCQMPRPRTGTGPSRIPFPVGSLPVERKIRQKNSSILLRRFPLFSKISILIVFWAMRFFKRKIRVKE